MSPPPGAAGGFFFSGWPAIATSGGGDRPAEDRRAVWPSAGPRRLDVPTPARRARSAGWAGPRELEGLDKLTVVIRDAPPWRSQGTPLAAGPTREQVAEQIWGRYKFTRGVGPGADPATGLFGADRTGRTCPAGEMFVGERLLFQLDPTWPPSWSQWSLESWQEKVGPLLRLRLECHREGQAPWILPCEVLVQDGVGSTEVPEQSSP